MKTEDLVLLPLTVYGIPSGNYDGSSEDWAGERQKAVGYYREPAGVQSVMFETLNFVGILDIQATLDADPQTDNAWFSVLEINPGSGAQTMSVPVKGNFTWMRIRVREFSAGQITSITVTY
jgi:hypothetical protein